MIGREHNIARRKRGDREGKMESAVPRWQEGSPLAFCQRGGSREAAVEGLLIGREKGRARARGVIGAG